MKSIIVLWLGLFFMISCNAQHANQKANTKDWHSDLDYLAKKLSKKHCDLFAQKSREYFLHEIEKIKSSVNDLSDFEVAIQLQQLVASMGDSHTKVHFSPLVDKKQILPIHLYWFSDGLYILHTTPENAEILGHRIYSVNQTPIDVVVDSLSTLITVDNQAMVKSSIPKLLPLVQVLDYFNFTEAKQIELGLEDINGNSKWYSLKPEVMNRENRKTLNVDSLALCFKNERAFFVDYYQANDEIYYIQYNKCWSKELEIKYRKGKNASKMPSFNDFQEKVFHNLAIKSIDKIVFDLRFNGGGNSSQGTAFIKKFAAFANENPEKRIFVILGRHTFSSAILNAMDFKKWTNATFVGEETGGMPNHFGEVRTLRLPYSGLRVGYSTKYFKRTEDKTNSLYPDVKIESGFNDFKSGIDPVYEWIKAK